MCSVTQRRSESQGWSSRAVENVKKPAASAALFSDNDRYCCGYATGANKQALPALEIGGKKKVHHSDEGMVSRK
jgi:hypothetical protein